MSNAAAGTRKRFASRRWFALLMVAAAMLTAAVLGLMGLSNQAFWDDEANTAIYARNLLQLGKLTAWDGTNLVGYAYGGALGEDLGRELRVPPLPAYVAAAGIWLCGQTTFGGRMMFVVAGVLSIGLLAWWMRRHFGRRFPWWLPSVILALSPAYLLYIRNCRYYALGVMFSLLVWVCWAPGGSRHGQLHVSLFNRLTLLRYAAAVVALVLLLSTHYLNAASMLVTLPLFFFDPRYRRARQYVLLGILYATAAVYGGCVLATANPFAAEYGWADDWLFPISSGLERGAQAADVPTVDEATEPVPSRPGPDRWTHFRQHLWWLLRDLGTHEFFPWCLVAVLAVPWLWPRARRGRPLARRGLILLGLVLSYVVLAATFTPPDMAKGPWAEMRYVVPLIVIGAVFGGLTLTILRELYRPLAPLVFLLLTLTNLLHLGFLTPRLDMTNPCWPPMLARYVREQLHDYQTGNEEMIALLGQLPPGTTVRTWPTYFTHPAIFYVSKLHYCDQLTVRKKIRDDLKPKLPDYLFVERAEPQVLLVPAAYLGYGVDALDGRFGPDSYQVRKALSAYWGYTSKPEIPVHFFAAPQPNWRKWPGMVVLVRKGSPLADDPALLPDRSDAEAMYRLGLALRDGGQLEAAIAHLVESLRIAPKRPAVHVHLGAMLVRRGKFDEAIEHYQAAIALDPQFAEAYVNLGLAMERLNRPKDAERQYRKAMEVDPDLPSAYYNLANLLAEQGAVDEAIRQYQRALAINPKHAGAHVNLGIVLAGRGRFPDAIDHYRAALRVEPRMVAARVQLAQALAAIGDLPEAIAELDAALTLVPPQSSKARWIREKLAMLRQEQ